MVRAYVMIKVAAGGYFGVEKTTGEQIKKIPEVIKVDCSPGVVSQFYAVMCQLNP